MSFSMGDLAMRSDPYGPTVRKDSGVEPAASADTLAPGQTWGKFLIEKKLGGGGQAQVFQAFDQLGTAGHVALKVPTSHIPPSHIQAWIETESGALVKLEHPNIVHVLDAGLIGGLPYVATPLVEGLTMHEHVQANPPSPRQIVSWMMQLPDALHSAHSRGIVHRDVKPRNVMITVEGKPMLIDFGVASLIS
ncbi:MAG: serine/threonine protein kinase, partial [Planctomycetota bacterium]